MVVCIGFSVGCTKKDIVLMDTGGLTNSEEIKEDIEEDKIAREFISTHCNLQNAEKDTLGVANSLNEKAISNNDNFIFLFKRSGESFIVTYQDLNPLTLGGEVSVRFDLKTCRLLSFEAFQ